MRSEELVQLGPAQARAAFEFSAAHPEQCTLIAGWLAEGGLAHEPRAPRAWLLAEGDGRIEGLCYLSDGGIVLPALSSEGALDALAELARRNPAAVRVIVGERAVVASLWRRLERAGARARICRDQLGYAVERGQLPDSAPSLPLTIATFAELEQVVAASADMAREEARDDPERRNPMLFRARIRERLERQRDFVHLDERRLLFKANVSALSAVGGLVEGIYTAPEARRLGLGLGGTATVTRWVLERSPRASLLVNEDNEPAKRLYRRLGYRQVLESRTIFLAP